MTRRIITLILILSSIMIAQNKGPKLSVSEDEHNFGNIKEGDVVEHDFILKNMGDEILKISKVRASCGCTAAKPDKNELAPGESTEVHVSFNSRGRSGKQSKYVYIMSNDPDTPQKRVKIMSNVLSDEAIEAIPNSPKLVMAPSQYNFGKVIEGIVAQGSLNIMNKGKSKLIINEVSSSCSCLEASLDNLTIEPNASKKLNFKFDTTNRTGKLTRTVTLKTNDPANAEKIVTFYIQIIPKES